jgi:hypothetical protein
MNPGDINNRNGVNFCQDLPAMWEFCQWKWCLPVQADYYWELKTEDPDMYKGL